MTESPSSEYDLLPHDPETGGPVGETDEKEARAEEPKPKSAPQAPPKPLPRLHKSAPLTVGEAEAAESATSEGEGRPRPSRKERQAAREREAAREKRSVGADLDGKKPMEATPELDTVEGRQKVRILLGFVAAGAVALAIFMVVQAFSGGGSGGDEEYTLEASDLSGPDLSQGPARKAAPASLPGAPRNDAMAPSRPPAGNLTVPRLGASNNATGTNAAAPAAAPAEVAATTPLAPATGADISTTPGVGAVYSGPPLPKGFAPHPEAMRDQGSGYPSRIVCERDGSEMLLVPAGVYLLGRNDGSVAEAPAVRVQLPAYYLDRNEVTVEQYQLFRDEVLKRGERIGPEPSELAAVATTPKHPIVLVTWTEAAAYAAWAGKVLPTEAQWEAAARGYDGVQKPWGLGAPSWGSSRAFRQIDPIGSYPQDLTSAYSYPPGFSDLAANAWEWTADWYDARYHESLARAPVVNPGGPGASRTAQRTTKGTSRTYEASYREGMRVDTRMPSLGFRCCLPLGGPPLAVEAGAAPSGTPAPSQGSSGAGVVPF